MTKLNNFQVIIIGGGHAGTEAASASARMGYKTLLLTQKKKNIGCLSCNPSIGGIGKSHLVKEIDALGGIMGLAIDQSGIQFKILNTRKGIAVRSTRAQADRVLYSKFVQQYLKQHAKLTILEQEVNDIIIKNNNVIGVKTKHNNLFFSKSVVLTTGTFLGGKIHIGDKTTIGGRKGDISSIPLALKLRELPLKVGRLKTGTPPRLALKSINFKNLKKQNGDFPLPYFSFLKKNCIRPAQIPCFLTFTNNETHEIIYENINKSAIYNGKIIGIGPRYCPSIEDKVMRFKDKNRHQIFLEPEGLKSELIYPNGISTSLPFSIQKKIIHSIEGLENAEIVQPGYAVEYDYFNPKDLKLNLESKYINGLFFAGQINGTTGYEEAAAQGLLAGINAARFSNNLEPWFPRRDQAYLGVMIDDLCTQGITEPYRIFTSRAEYRLSLRENNADLRLTKIGKKLNLIDTKRWLRYIEKIENIEKYQTILKKNICFKKSENAKSIFVFTTLNIKENITYFDLLKRPELSIHTLINLNLIKNKNLDIEALEELETNIKYHGYILRQKKEIIRQILYEKSLLPINFDYNQIKGLSKEVISKLNTSQPFSLGQASRIEGITPAALSILLIYIKNNFFLNKY
ncbi:tRNA uridine 5-carboxymethylaminomethyl modification enzyme MnmG [Buchnera aphidicola (Thelaxes suberi)]|uniref:tRNA uridine-5-carboxymethylaminomethyl(34) synthesis enzyme MnmG n=1 Tax=Buchnera aphidicola TaxID=9 RepID=UPI003464A038